jgi:hypothetical protein
MDDISKHQSKLLHEKVQSSVADVIKNDVNFICKSIIVLVEKRINFFL